MPVPTQDVVEITLVGDQSNQLVTNVFHYVKESPSIQASEIAQAVASSFIIECLPDLSTSYTLRQVNYRNLFDDSEQGELDILDQTGAAAVDALPPHDTLSMQLLHDEPAIRNGRKSFSGITEFIQTNGLIAPASLSALDAGFGTFVTEAIKDVATQTITIARPVIVKRIAEVVGAVTRYRLPNNALEALVGFVYDVVLDAYVRTQNSRKVGRGA